VRSASRASSRSRRSYGRPEPLAVEWKPFPPGLGDVLEPPPGHVRRRRPAQPLQRVRDDLERRVIVDPAERRAGNASLDQHRARPGVVVDQAYGTTAVPEPERIRLVHAFDVVVDVDLDDDLHAVREAGRRNELRERRVKGLAELEVPGEVQWAPCEDTGSTMTVSSEKRSSSSAAHVTGSSAQAITVGPEPDSVAPTAPAGSSARIAFSRGDGR
jgi:hypothetical protein